MKQQRTINIFVLLTALVLGALPVWGVTETRNGKQYNVVYLKTSASGNGDSKDTPLGSWSAAYKKLTNTGNRDYDWEHNIIVIVGDMQINYKEGDTKDKSNKQGTAATITGVWPWDANDKATTADIKNGGQAKIAGIDNNIGADVRFRNLRIQGDGGLQDRLSLRLHSTCFDEGLVMMGFAELGTAYGMISNRKAPALHLQLSFDQISGSSVRPSHVVYEMPGDSAMTVIFKSGKYGRIAVSRTQGNLVTTNYVQGTPNHPVMAHVIVDMQDGNDNTGDYADDISIMIGGSSQGFVCADLQYDLKHGSIGTMVAGSQGNNVAACVTNKIPAETFAGRTQVNIGVVGGADGDFTIQTYYGGTQGRSGTTGANASAYFYGESEFNMYSGTIKAGVFSSATAFSGLCYEKDHSKHTPDYAIPYVDANNDLAFGSYKEGGIMGVVKSSFRGNVDLSTTKITLNIYGGVIEGGVYGGSRGYEPLVTTQYAPDNCGTHFGNTYVNVYGGTIEGGVYGGGLGTTEYYESNQKEGFLTVAQVYGNTNVNIYGGDIRGDIFGGGSGVGSTSKNQYLDVAKVFGTTNVTINPTDPAWTFTGNIYGGGALSAVEGTTNVQILGGNITGNVYAASAGEAGHADKGKIVGNPGATLAGGTISENIYGGGELAPVEGNPAITINGGTVTESVYGGGYGATAVITGDPTVNITDGTVTENVFGGGSLANTDGSTTITVSGGTVTNDVYGGGALANVSGNTTVNLTGGTIGNSYGGGLGSNEVAAIVNGDASTTLNGSKVTGSVFGANNVNGTPKGHVKVHVLSTTPRDGQADDEYDVAAVYGGGNQAAYVPSQATFDAEKGYTEVLVENCDNSIEYVYGGGNAAPVPATEVTIYGANAINDAFAGGNGAGAGNPGADIGYNGYYSQTGEETPTYGTGITRITVYGGTVNNVFGGSNTLGYVREHAYASVLDRPNDYTGAECALKVGEVYGAGNKAEMYCPSTMEMACSAGADAIYGGAKQVNFYGDVTLNIVSGTYGKVFGGNNMSGNVLGSITINVDETGCFPVKIGELYGGGNLAAYSVYGYDNEGHCITRESDMPDHTKKYADPTINLISFTEIGKVFGGGLGESAVVYGNPTVNINPIKGKPAGETSDAVGTIGTIYGGGNEAAVYGNTNVNIATEATNNHLNAKPGDEPETVDAIITGNVYGGGSQADVHGSTNVTIGQ